MSEKILVVDDEESIRTSLAGILEDEDFSISIADDGVAALALVEKSMPDLVLLDIWMPRMDGLETLQRLKEINPSLVVIMMSGHGTIETAVKSTKMGAFDFIEKPLSLEKLLVTVRNALSMKQLRAENNTLRELAFGEHEMTGTSPPMAKLKEQIRLVAPTNASVLITGENGTGKELVARSIHFCSLRRDKPFVALNCSAIPATLIESELFGYERGAFTGADQRRLGNFELAHDGTLFLDEIGELPLELQAKFLRVLEDHRIRRLGGRSEVEVDVRVICATNRDLKEEIKRGR